MKKSNHSTPKLDPQLTRNIFQRPDFLNNLPGRGDTGREIAKLASQVNSLDSSQCVKFEVNEFDTRFKLGQRDMKKFLLYIKTQLKVAHNVHKPRAAFEEGKIYFWRNM